MTVADDLSTYLATLRVFSPASTARVEAEIARLEREVRQQDVLIQRWNVLIQRWMSEAEALARLDVPSNTTTTADPASGLLLRVFREGDGICVKDTTGLRYGWGRTLREAVEMWADCVQDCLDETNASGSYLAECRAYREAL